MQYDNTDLVEALEIFGQDYIAELGNQLRKAGKDASGNLLRSLDSRIIKTAMGTIYTINIIGEDYLKYVDGGRRPGKTPPPVKGTKGAPLREWVRIKGLPQGAAFPIAKNIGKNGIEPTNVISKSLKAVQIGGAYRDFEDGVTDWVDDLMNQLLLDVSKNNNITVRTR